MSEKLKQWVLDQLAQIIRVGVIVGRDDTTMRVRIHVSDTVTDEFTSDWLQVLVLRAKKDRCYDLPDLGDQALAIFLPFAKEVGFVIGCMYGADTPPVTSGDKWHRIFKDGTYLEYDRAAHELTARVKGKVNVIADSDITAESGTKVDVWAATSIAMTAPNIYQNGNVTAGGESPGSTATVSEKAYRTLEGSLTVNGPTTLNGAVICTGGVTINGDLTVNGNSAVTGNSQAGTRSGGSI